CLCPRRFVMSIILNVRTSRQRRLFWSAWVPLLILGMAGNGCADPSAPLDPPPEVTGALPLGQAVTYWPIALEATEGRVEVYQPQPEAMTGNTLTARAAVSLTRPQAAAPTFGAALFTARVR